MTDTIKHEGHKLTSRAKKRAVFYAIMVIPLLVQFAIFYFYVNIETFILAFKEYVFVGPGEPYVVRFAGFKNFIAAFNWLIATPSYYLNSLKFYFWNLIIGMPLALLFSFYMYKRLPLSGTFKYFLFLPHILSGLLVVILYRFLIEDVYMAVCEQWFGMTDAVGLLNKTRPVATRFAMIIIYNIWVGFGTNVLVYVSTMEGVDTSLVESAQLDGANIMQEFLLITMPMIWTTFMTFFLTTLTGIFTTNMSLYSFYAQSCPDDMAVIGYKLYVLTLQGNLATENVAGRLNYSAMSGISLIVTAVLTPITLLIRKAFLKWGPSVN